MILLGERFQPHYYIGHKLRVFLKLGGVFNVLVTSRVNNYINCIVDDGEEITIDLDDVDFYVDLGQI